MCNATYYTACSASSTALCLCTWSCTVGIHFESQDCPEIVCLFGDSLDKFCNSPRTINERTLNHPPSTARVIQLFHLPPTDRPDIPSTSPRQTRCSIYLPPTDQMFRLPPTDSPDVPSTSHRQTSCSIYLPPTAHYSPDVRASSGGRGVAP
jgi:hypothetical protein